MSVDHPILLIAVIGAASPLALLARAWIRARRRRGEAFARVPLRALAMPSWKGPWLAIVLLGAALAGVRVGEERREHVARGLDVVFALDASRSMLVRDLAPDRLSRARREILDVVRRARGARFALVVFGGRAEVRCPLTRDAVAFEDFLAGVEPSLVRSGGSDLWSGVEGALGCFDRESRAHRVVIAVGDGEQTVATTPAVAVTDRARDLGAVVHAILTATADGGGVPASEVDPGPLLEEGRPVVSRADARELARASRATGGVLVDAAVEPRAGAALYEIALADIDAPEGAVTWKTVGVDRFRWLLVAALLGLLVGSRPIEAWRWRRAAFAGGALLLCIGWDAADDLAAEGERHFDSGSYAAAAASFERLLRERPRDPGAAYNLAVSRLRSGDLEGARAALDHGIASLEASGLSGGAELRKARGLVLALLAEGERSGGRDSRSLLARARLDLARAAADGGDEAAAFNLLVVCARLCQLERTERSETNAGRSDAADSGEDSGGDSERPDPVSEADSAGGIPDHAEEAPGEPAARAGAESDARAPSGGIVADWTEVDRLRIEEIVARFLEERRRLDLSRARHARAHVERDW